MKCLKISRHNCGLRNFIFNRAITPPICKNNQLENNKFGCDITFQRHLIADRTNYDIINKSIKQIMTYIICGRLNNKLFLMVDCVGTSNHEGVRKYHYRDKLTKLISTTDETYCSLTGIDALQFAINAFDMKCYQNNMNFDFKNIKHINEILELYKLIINRPEYYGKMPVEINFNRIYFINCCGIFYISVNKFFEASELMEVENNRIIDPYCQFDTPNNLKKSFADNSDLINYCKNQINRFQDYGFDLKDKFSFIMFDENKKIYVNPSNNNEELILSIVGAEYGKITPD